MQYCNWKATMTFNFFGFKKRPDIEDVVPKEVLAPEPPIEIQPPTTNEVPIGLVTTREDVIAAYKIFLGRLPESEEVITLWLNTNPEAVLAGFLKSQEFLSHPQKGPFILALAKKILEDRKQRESSANTVAPTPETA